MSKIHTLAEVKAKYGEKGAWHTGNCGHEVVRLCEVMLDAVRAWVYIPLQDGAWHNTDRFISNPDFDLLKVRISRET